MRLADVPELDISFVQNSEFPTGLIEPSLIAVAPAIGNAIFNAVGVRMRKSAQLTYHTNDCKSLNIGYISRLNTIF